jgi:hypothetical protein
MALPSEDSEDACLIISDCDVSYNYAYDPGSSLTAVEMLQHLLEECEELSENNRKACGWDPTGHEALEMHSVVDQWKEQIARW